MKKYSILYVDDEVSNLNIFKNTFRRNYNVFTAKSAREGLEILDHYKIDLVLTDQRMPEMTGVEFLKNVIVKYPKPNRILITAYTDFNALKEAVNEAKIFQYIQKPWDENEIQKIIDNALDIYILKQKNLELTEQLKKSNEQLSKLNLELLELDKLKLEFLNIISHEIRTPLNGLLGVTSLLKSEIDDEVYEKYSGYFDMLEVSTKRLEHFLLLAERITAFKAQNYKLTPECFDIKKLIEKVIFLIKDKTRNKQIDIQFEDNKQNEHVCYADQSLVEICLLEIIDNAIKYANVSGKIVIKSNLIGEKLIIEVVDNGPGFPENVLNNVFKTFITDQKMTSRGMGLDLALIHLIIDAHKGEIFISNNKNGGATVKLEFNATWDQTEE